MKNNDEEVIWKDRKRFCGLPISFTKYSVKNNRLYNSVGLLSSKENEILLYRILDFKLEITLINRIFGVGTVTIYTCDKTDKELKLVRIKNPKNVRDMLSKMVEEARGKLKIKGKEIYGAADSDSYEELVDE
ncbi:MAG: PH domain-containing protein [Clostridiales bacterium]|nr:PH domain-containing protein [Clostridiales bacterium]